jgi:hypothetical protein
MVQYRHGSWQDSLTALEKVKALHGDLDGLSWFLTAMNRHQLKQREQALAAQRKGVEWMAEQERAARGNALLRVQYEALRPTLEALRKEAEQLLEGG